MAWKEDGGSGYYILIIYKNIFHLTIIILIFSVFQINVSMNACNCYKYTHYVLWKATLQSAHMALTCWVLFFLITVHLKENYTVSILREVLQDPPLLLPVANFFAAVAIEYQCYFAAVTSWYIELWRCRFFPSSDKMHKCAFSMAKSIRCQTSFLYHFQARLILLS